MLSRLFSLIALVLCPLIPYLSAQDSDFPLDLKSMLQEIAHCEQMAQTHELETMSIPERYFHNSPIMVDDKRITSYALDVSRNGKLTMIYETEKSKEPLLIPFTVQIRRDGQTLEGCHYDQLKQVRYNIQMKDIRDKCRLGDQIIFNPVNKGDWMAKRILWIKSGDGC